MLLWSSAGDGDGCGAAMAGTWPVFSAASRRCSPSSLPRLSRFSNCPSSDDAASSAASHALASARHIFPQPGRHRHHDQRGNDGAARPVTSPTSTRWRCWPAGPGPQPGTSSPHSASAIDEPSPPSASRALSLGSAARVRFDPTPADAAASAGLGMECRTTVSSQSWSVARSLHRTAGSPSTRWLPTGASARQSETRVSASELSVLIDHGDGRGQRQGTDISAVRTQCGQSRPGGTGLGPALNTGS